MKKTFVIQVEYPDCDFVPSEEVIEVTQECIDQYLERYFGANIMDGDYDRIKVKEVTNGFSLVEQMRKAQKRQEYTDSTLDIEAMHECRKLTKQRESEVDEYLKKMEE